MLSVVIPTLNEAENLTTTIKRCGWAADGAAMEIIVSDCGSTDGTRRLAKQLGVGLAYGATSRADALNRGAALAEGDTLLFLHADTLPPRGFARAIGRVLADPDYVGGAFDIEFRCDPSADERDLRMLRWVLTFSRLRYRWSGNFFGGQSIFVRRDVFERIGGFPSVQALEGIALSRRLHRYGKTAILRPPVRISPHRFLSTGVVRRMLANLAVLACDSVGLQPKGLVDEYDYTLLNGQSDA